MDGTPPEQEGPGGLVLNVRVPPPRSFSEAVHRTVFDIYLIKVM